MKPFSEFEYDVSPHSPGGWLIRREWLPVATSRELPAAGSKLSVMVCEERILLARLESGTVLAIQERCPHRGASLLYGTVINESIRCAYHGWTFDNRGRCLKRPFDQLGDEAKVKASSYPTLERYGLIFVFLGDDEFPPPFRRYDNLENSSLHVVARRHQTVACNWLTFQENAADVVHTYFLHGAMTLDLTGSDPTGFSAKMTAYGFQPTHFGLIKTWRYQLGNGESAFGFGNLLVLPNILCIETEVHWRVPRTRAETDVFIVSLESGPQPDAGVIEFRGQDGKYLLNTPFGQDAMALETSHSFREEILARSDYGVQIFREQIRLLFKSRATNAVNATNSCKIETVFAARDHMGGYLPSTGTERRNFVGLDTDKWSAIQDKSYLEFKVE